MASTGNYNGVQVVKNVNFDHTAPNPRVGIITQDGDLIIGSIESNPNIAAKKGRLVSSDATVDISYDEPDLDLTAGLNGLATITPDEDFDGTAATPLKPQNSNVNAKTYNPSLANILRSINSDGTDAGDLKFEYRAWLTALVVDPSSTIGERGTFSTIQAAINAASAGDTIFVRNGDYVEDLTLKDGVFVTTFSTNQFASQILITGKHSLATGTVSFCGFRFENNGDFAFSLTGGTIRAIDCALTAIDSQLISNAGGTISLIRCRYTTTGAFGLITQSSGSFQALWTIGTSGSSGATNAISGGSILLEYSQMTEPFVLSNAASALVYYSRFPHNGKCFDCQGTSYLESWFNQFNSGSNAAVSIAAGAQADLWNCNINSSSATYSVDGTGTLDYNCLTFSNTNFVIDPGLTVLDRTIANQSVTVTSPAAYPYTAKPQDYIIIVDTSSARTINLNATPRRGQTYRIKDNIGSAATNNITVSPAAGNIDGAASYVINVNYASVDLTYNGTQWNVL